MQSTEPPAPAVHQVSEECAQFVRRARADPAVVGLVLSGSQAKDGMATERSDHDLYVVLGGGGIVELVRQKAELGPDEARTAADAALDAYINYAYRSLKSHRDGRRTAARLDAAESVPFLLTALFALHGRLRPYNKYLQWELFADIERAARPAHEQVLDSWGADLELLRPPVH